MVELEAEHVHKVYSEIAAHFSDTRFKPWPRIAHFLQEQASGSLIADVGCGNGKYLGVNPQLYMLGSDICPELISIGRSRGHEVITCDCLRLPYRNDLFDGIICIAVIHHLSTEHRRVAAIREMARILCPGGRMLVYVWAMEQERKKFDSQDVMVPWHLQPKYKAGSHKDSTKQNKSKTGGQGKAAKARTKKEEKKRRKRELVMESGQIEIAASEDDEGTLFDDLAGLDLEDEDLECYRTRPSQSSAKQLEPHTTAVVGDDGTKLAECESVLGDPKAELKDLGYTTYQRYYHVFKEGELVDLIGKVSELTVDKHFYDHENWCVLATKV